VRIVKVMTTVERVWQGIGVSAIGAALVTASAGVALAQNADDPNPGAVTFTGNFDVPSLYVFRGIVQESDPKITLFPSADLGIALTDKMTVNLGTWHSLHTGSSGSDGATGRVHYEEDFYATLGLALNGGFSLGTTFTAYTSPNFLFNTVKELSFKLAKAHKLSPYGIVAFELDGAADGTDDGAGTYLELGVGPSVRLGGSKATLTVPVKLGVSLKNYYQNSDGDQKFGFLDIGGLVTFPLSGVPAKYGTWNVHAGADVFVFGDTTKAFNSGDTAKVVGLIGLGLTY
jgi:hypothetical protein